MTWVRISNGRTVLLVLAATLVLVAAASVRAALDPAHLETWKLPEASLYGVTAHGSNAWAAGYWGTILTSTDGGKTWTQPNTPTAKTLFGISFADDNNGWAVGADGTILHSTDGGKTWAAQKAETSDEMGQSAPVNVNLFGVAALSPTEAWIVGDLGMVLRTRDGQTWEKVSFDAASYGDDNVPERLLNA
ncbi:MAG: WD40/YVTN/BNR-like repeat-containing protein, partial [bacterium]